VERLRDVLDAPVPAPRGLRWFGLSAALVPTGCFAGFALTEEYALLGIGWFLTIALSIATDLWASRCVEERFERAMRRRARQRSGN
jgi:hypothetical protein